jgi:hypothetical protein
MRKCIHLEKGCQEGKAHEETEIASTYDRALAGESYSRGEETLVSGKHPGASESVNGIRRRAGKYKDAEEISKDTEKYSSSIWEIRGRCHH